MSPVAEPCDNELVARVRVSGDTAAFGELVRRHQSQLRQFLLRLCRDTALADDLAQDSFLHAWDKLASYRGDGSFIGWLLRIGWTTFLQSKRRSNRYAEVVDAWSDDPRSARATAPVEEVGDLDRLLAVLGEEERAVMILAYGFGMSHREISETTGQPIGTVKSIIHRGKEKIRKDFEIPSHQTG